MGYFNQYVRAESLEEAYGLYQKKIILFSAVCSGSKMRKRPFGTAIDLSDLGLDQIEEDEKEFRIGAYVSLRELETNEALNAYTKGAFAESVKHIVGVQFRNVATVGRQPLGTLWIFGCDDDLPCHGCKGAAASCEASLDLDEFCKNAKKDKGIFLFP